jgi:hypothetical protein
MITELENYYSKLIQCLIVGDLKWINAFIAMNVYSHNIMNIYALFLKSSVRNNENTK